MGIPGARSPPVAPRCRVQHRAWWHSGTSEGGLQQGDPCGTPVPHMADVPVPGTPPALLPWGLVAVPSVSAPHLCSPAEGLVMGGRDWGWGVPLGSWGATGLSQHLPLTLLLSPAAAVTRRAAGTATRRPRTPSSSTGTGQRPGVPGEPGQGVPVQGGADVSAASLALTTSEPLRAPCSLFSAVCATGTAAPAPARGPGGQGGAPPARAIACGWHRTRQRLASTQMLAPAAPCGPTDPHPCVPMSPVPTSPCPHVPVSPHWAVVAASRDRWGRAARGQRGTSTVHQTNQQLSHCHQPDGAAGPHAAGRAWHGVPRRVPTGEGQPRVPPSLLLRGG